VPPDPNDPLAIFQQPGEAPDDARFRYEIIKGLAESVRQLTAGIADMQKTQVSMLERLATLEANKVGIEIRDIKKDLRELIHKVDELESTRDKTEGRNSAMTWVLKYGPVIFSLFAALWLFGRSVGIVPAPPAPVERTEAAIVQREPVVEKKATPDVH
jgi:hypothetical protein